MTNEKVVHLADGFWNIRGIHKFAGLVNIGTQSSLVRLSSGKFVLLDAYTLQGDVLKEVMDLTNQGQDIEAVINLHPYHTLYVQGLATLLPEAKFYGTQRHVEEVPGVTWEALRSDTSAMHALYQDDLVFTVPRGVYMVHPQDDKVHFSSVLVLHKASGALHVDDTLMWVPLPLIGGVSFHPTLKKALEPRAGAAEEFRQWTRSLSTLCADARHLCTAHASLPPRSEHTKIVEHVRKACQKAEGILKAHEARYG